MAPKLGQNISKNEDLVGCSQSEVVGVDQSGQGTTTTRSLTLTWPPNSPDLNMCGVCWTIISLSWVVISNHTDLNSRKLDRCFRLSQIVAGTRL